MNILKLTVKNFKRLTGIDIIVGAEGLVVIGGENAQGKSSLLDSIAFALCGARFKPDRPLRDGAEKGSVRVEFEGGIVVTRTMTKKGGGTLRIETADGMSPRAPQRWLDERLGALTFDPLAFMRLTGKEQAKVLRELTGCDTTALDKKRQAAFGGRRDIGRDGKVAAATAGAMVSFPEAPETPVNVEALFAEQAENDRVDRAAALDERAVEQNRAAAATKLSLAKERIADAENIEKRIDTTATLAAMAAEHLNERAGIESEFERELEAVRLRCVKAVEAAELRQKGERDRVAEASARDKALAAQLRADANQAETHASNFERAAADCEARAKAARATMKDPAEIRQRIANAGTTNEQVDANARKLEALKKAQQLREDYAAKTAEIEAIDKERKAMLAAVDFPIDGLTFDESGLTFEDVPLSQASQAEQIRVGMAISLASDPTIRVALIREGSLLDEASMELVAEIAREYGAQVWIERVSDRDESAIIIEEGEVREPKDELELDTADGDK